MRGDISDRGLIESSALLLTDMVLSGIVRQSTRNTIEDRGKNSSISFHSIQGIENTLEELVLG